MSNYEATYQYLIKRILASPHKQKSRTGMTMVCYNTIIHADLEEGFPMLTGRKMFWKNIMGEAEWMLSGSTNVKDLHKYDVHIWDKWANEDGELGPTYGAQLKDQWDGAIQLIRLNPESRRNVISLWSVDELQQMALPPCYYALQFYVTGNLLNVTVNARSSDVAVGLPYDIAVCAYLLCTAAMETEHIPGRVSFSCCNSHINVENLLAIKQYLERPTHPLPFLAANIYAELELENYKSEDHIQMVVKE